MGSTENGHERSAIFHRNGRKRQIRSKKRDPVSRKKGEEKGFFLKGHPETFHKCRQKLSDLKGEQGLLVSFI
jgi:hypothetical protein